jgi:hypothetical protein
MDSNLAPEHAEMRLFEAIIQQTPDAIVFADCDGKLPVCQEPRIGRCYSG